MILIVCMSAKKSYLTKSYFKTFENVCHSKLWSAISGFLLLFFNDYREPKTNVITCHLRSVKKAQITLNGWNQQEVELKHATGAMPGSASYNQCHFVETLSVQLCLPPSPTRQCWKKVSTKLMKTSAHNTMQHWIGEGGEGVSTTCVTGCIWFKRIMI